MADNRSLPLERRRQRTCGLLTSRRAAARRRLFLLRWHREPMPPLGSPEEVTEQHAWSAVLLRALDKLSFDQRTAFVLCEVEERSSPEVAEILGVPEATIRTRLFHARKKLRAQLEREGLR